MADPSIASLIRLLSQSNVQTSEPPPKTANDPPPAGDYGVPYNHDIDRLAGMRQMMPVLRQLGLGNPAGVVPGAMGVASDLYGLFNPNYQRGMTNATRDMYRQQQTIRDAEGQPGGFYGNKK